MIATVTAARMNMTTNNPMTEQAKNAWLPIESAPKDGTRFLAAWPLEKTQTWLETYWDDDTSQGDKPFWYAPSWGHITDGLTPTRWMPLPPEDV